MSNKIYIIVGTSIGILAVAAMIIIYKFYANKKKSLEALLKKQVVVNELESLNAKGWFLEQNEKNVDATHGLLVKVTPSLLKQLGYRGNCNIDCEHYILQAISNGESIDEILEMRLINFEIMGEKLKEAFKETDVLVISLK